MKKVAAQKKNVVKKVPHPAGRPGPAKKALRLPDWYLVATAILILVVSLIRIRLADVPLERDEGEYAYMGNLILEGLAPYKAAYNMKLPGTYLMYSIILGIFGNTPEGIHYGLMLFNAGTMLLLFLAVRRLFNPLIAIFTAGGYGMMALSFTVMGFAAHATHFATFFCAAGLYFLARFSNGLKSSNAFLAGLAMGLSFLMKQQAVFFLIFGGIAMLLLLRQTKQPIKRMILPSLVYSGGVFLPYLITCGVLLLAGAFDNFWFWTVQYASKYASAVSLSDGLTLLERVFKSIWNDMQYFWILFFLGLAAIFFSGLSKTQKTLALLFTLMAFLTVTPGLLFREHYFIPFLPAVALMGGVTLFAATEIVKRFTRFTWAGIFAVGVLAVIIISMLTSQKEYYFNASGEIISKSVYGSNPFVESIEIARYIKENSAPADRVAVLGSEPQIYFYSDRRAATGHIYTYGLMEDQPYNLRMQEEMISEIERTQPKYLVFCGIQTSWLRRPQSPSRIFEWYNSYANAYYTLAGLADILPDQTIYKWDDGVLGYQMKGQNSVFILKRK
ncbi:MAG TPA: glycosyltransferase family 39 protein [Flavisolibacter sp.]